MSHQSLYPKKEKSFIEKHELLIIFSLGALLVCMVFVVAYAIADHSIFTSLGGV